MLRENFKTIHAARYEFLRLESNEKLRRAPRSNVISALSENINEMSERNKLLLTSKNLFSCGKTLIMYFGSE